ncbi:MAG: sulfatase-like hydrolase/transferase, partial [Methylococcaceae bacterium]|nr:sulfatase-like hydrolase/transferase [Methylococcaceae bacterium]
ILSVDTLRADHVSAYANSRVDTPNLARFSKRAMVFENAVSPIPVTNPSHTSMLTGLYPGNHDIQRNRAIEIDPTVKVLPELLAKVGYVSAGFVSAAPLSDRHSKLSEKFGLYDDDIFGNPKVPDMVEQDPLFRFLAADPPERFRRPAEETVTAVIDWLRSNKSTNFSLFVHLFDPHGPYQPPPPYDRLAGPMPDGARDIKNFYQLSPSERLAVTSDSETVEYLKKLYAAEVAYVDSQIGRLLGELERLRLLNSTVIVFTSDHGESLTEHNYFFDHSGDLYQPSLHVPLMIRFPDGTGAGQRFRSPVSLIDIMPTVLEYLNIEVPAKLDGSSLLGRVRRHQDAVSNQFIISSVFDGGSFEFKRMLSLRSPRHKYIYIAPYWVDFVLVPAREELYDLVTDPREQHNIIAERPDTAQKLREVADRYWVDWDGLLKEDVDVGSRSHDSSALKALGYIN